MAESHHGGFICDIGFFYKSTLESLNTVCDFFKIRRYLIYAQSAGIKNSLLVVFVDNCTGNVDRYLPFVRQCTAPLLVEQASSSTGFFSPLLLVNPASPYLGGTASMFC